MLYNDIFLARPDSCDIRKDRVQREETRVEQRVVETETEEKRQDVRAKLCERDVEMNDGCKITRSVHVKGSIVVARLSLAIYTLLRHGRALCERRRAALDSSEKRRSSRPTKLEGRLRHKVHMDGECDVAVVILDRQTDRRTSFKYRYPRRSGCEARRRSLEEKVHARIIPRVEKDGSIRRESIRITD